MIINSVHLRNFKSHVDTTIDFGPGINVILGENGAGKTSILEAISFALFKDYTGNLDRLVKNGHSEMVVEVVFTSHGRKYKVIRRRTKNSTDSKLLLLDGSEKELRSGDAGVDEEINSILDMDRYLFSNAIYVRQGEIERLLTETAHKKKQLIGRLLGIESLEKVWELMKPLTDRYKERKSVIEGEIMREDDVHKQREELGAQLSDVRKRLEKTRKSIDTTSGELQKAESEEKRLAEADRKYIGVSVKRDELSSMLERETERLESSRRQISEIGESKLETEEINRKLVHGWKAELEKQLSEKQKRMSGIDEKTGDLRGRTTEMNELGGKLESAGSRCPLCGSELTESHRKGMIRERREKLSSMQKETRQLIDERVRVSGDIEGLEARRREFTELEKRHVELRTISGRYGELARMAEGGEKIVQDLQTKIRTIESEMKELEKGRKQYEEAKERVRTLRDEVSGLKVACGNLEGKMQELNNSFERLEEEAAAMKARKSEHNKLAEFIKILSEIRSVFDKSGLQLELRKRAVPVIENHIREFFREFNFEYSDISLDENYDITLYGPAGESTTEMMSGGEKIAAALALRLGIARTLAGSTAETVMLDEPTIFLDEQRRQDLIEVLKKMTVIPQMIVVTHDTAMEDAADQITVIKKSKGVSTAES